MATKSTGWLCTHTASVISQTETTATIKVECFWTNNGWDYDINHVSAWVYCGTQSYKVKDAGSIDTGGDNSASVSCGSKTFTITKTTSTQKISCHAKITSNSSYVSGTKSSTAANVSVSAKTSYTISYNVNGGSGTIASQTKWHGEGLTITSSTPTRSGYTFVGWALSKDEADAGKWYYTPGSTCGANKALTLYAVWKASSYTITYNANAGSDTVSSMPSNQTKSPNVNVTISSSKPTRSKYEFKGWSASASSSTIVYNPGDTYSANASITLYAVWTAVQAPGITNLTAFRCDADGNSNSNGQYAKVEFDWAQSITTSNIAIAVTATVSGNTTAYTGISKNVTGSSGTYEGILGTSSKLFDLGTTYIINVKLQNSSGLTEASITLRSEDDYSLEFMPNNAGVYFPKAVHGNVLGLGDLPEIPSGDNYNNYTSTGVWSVKTNAIAATIANRPIDQAGRLIVAHAIGGQPDDSEFDYLIQTYIPYLISYHIYERHVRKTDSSTWIYSPWVVITRNRHSMISAWTGADITKTATGQTQIPLTGKTVVGDGLTISSNAIVIGQYVTAVEVSAAGMLACKSCMNAAAKNLIIKKNGTEIAVSMNGSWAHPVNSSNTPQSINFQLNISPKLISVTQGDKITFHWYASYSSTYGGDLLQCNSARTYITVKEF